MAACYFNTLFSKTEEVVDVIDHWLKHPRLGQVDCVVGIGLSGILPLVPVYQKSGVAIRAIRKRGDNAHGGVSAYSEDMEEIPKSRYVILDDFVSSGDTLRDLREKMERIAPGWECVGVLLYSQAKDGDQFLDIPIFGLAEEIAELAALRKGK